MCGQAAAAADESVGYGLHLLPLGALLVTVGGGWSFFRAPRTAHRAWLLENMLAVTTVGVILSLALLLLGVLGQFYADEEWAPTAIIDLLGDYSIWALILGLVFSAVSGYYLWLTRDYMRRFEELITTKSKAQFQRHWMELEQIARYHLPKEYSKRVAKVRKKFGLK